MVLLVLISGCGTRIPTLNILAFPDYVDPTLVKEFEAAFHCKVRFDYLNSGDAFAKISNGGGASYDILMGIGDPTGFVKEQLLLPLDQQSVPNLANIDPRFDLLSSVEGVRYTFPYLWGSTGLYVRRRTSGPIEESWSLIFDPAQNPGVFFLLNENRTCLGAALRYKGHSVNSTNQAELAEARDLLIATKKRSAGFIEGTAARNTILTKTADTTMAWSDSRAGEKEDSETHYLVPREGAAMILDGVAVLSKAPHRALALSFINFLLDAKIAARTATFLGAATPNKAALAFINPADAANPSIYLPSKLIDQLEPVRDAGHNAKLYDEIWTQIRAK